MSMMSVTTPITKKWLMDKTKTELAYIIMANLDQIDIFADGNPPLQMLEDVARSAEKVTDDAWVTIIEDMRMESRNGAVFENWGLVASARRALQKLRGIR